MSVYQFARMESFSRAGSARKKTTGSAKQFKNWSVSDVIGEALRAPENSPHIKNPRVPRVVYGSAENLKKSVDDYGKKTKTAAGRKLRTDALVMGSFVASYPGVTPGPDYEEWLAATLKFVEEKWGDRLRFAVEHLDEANPHTHFFLVEEPGHEFRLDPVKDAHRRETESARAAGIPDNEKGLLSRKNAAAIAAGEALNQEFFDKVSVRFGHLKDSGPDKRSRVTREQYLAQKAAKQKLKEAEALAAEAEKAAAEKIAAAETIAADVLQSVEPVRAELETAQNALEKTQKRAQEIKKAAIGEKREAAAALKAVERERQAIEQADPTKLKRTLGRFFVQFATRLVLVFALVLARPRQTKLRNMFLSAKKRARRLQEKATVLEVQREQLEKMHINDIKEKQELRGQVQAYKHENAQLQKQLEALAPKAANVHKLPARRTLG